MEFLLGMVVGWFALPYFLYGSLLFFLGFPFFFWNYDIYDNYRWRYGYWRTFIYVALTIAVLHFFTDFDALSLISGGFWASALSLWLYFVGYLAVGLAFSYLRFYFYAREYRRRMDERLAQYKPDSDSYRHQQEQEYRTRLSGYGSRLSLILKWIFHWPWSLLAWVLTDLLTDLFDTIVDVGRKIFGNAFGNIARSTEPEWMKERERAEKAAAAAKK